jgi:hypothetical protein
MTICRFVAVLCKLCAVREIVVEVLVDLKMNLKTSARDLNKIGSFYGTLD